MGFTFAMGCVGKLQCFNWDGCTRGVGPSPPPSLLGTGLDPQSTAGMCLFEGEGSLPRAEAVPWLGEAKELSQPLRARWQQGSDFGGFWRWGLPRGVTFQAPACFSWVSAALCKLDSFSSIIFSCFNGLNAIQSTK